jgi:predicted nucleic acid-binding protein
MAVPILILDTNVIVSSLRSSLGASYRLVNLIDRGVFEIGLTAPLVLEYEEVCKRLADELPITLDEVDQMLDFLCRVAKRGIIYFQSRPALSDPDDEMVLEAGIATSASWIVTHNIKDFSQANQKYGMDVLTPGESLERLGVIK